MNIATSGVLYFPTPSGYNVQNGQIITIRNITNNNIIVSLSANYYLLNNATLQTTNYYIGAQATNIFMYYSSIYYFLN